jgi:RHS repeat-associated protein
MRSELTSALRDSYLDTYSYDKAGNVTTHTSASAITSYGFFRGDLMTSASSTNGGDNFASIWNNNGNLTSVSAPAKSLVYNWDNKLRSATNGPNSISLKYDPMGNRVYKSSSAQGTRKYIVDIAGGLPTILMEVDPCTSSLTKAYIYANGEILVQHNGDDCMANRCFYLHDRLGSVRQVISYMTNGLVLNSYTYGSFGEMIAAECAETIDNPFKFTGQYYDFEIGQYYLRARQYDPQLMRFTGRDSVNGKLAEPITLHRYLYCGNEPISRIDPDGRYAITLSGSPSGSMTFGDMYGAISGMPCEKYTGNALASIASYYLLIMPLEVMNSHLMIAGTFGGGIIAAKDESVKGWNKGWSFGGMFYRAAGGAIASSTGGSLTLNFGYSSKAQNVKDLAGRYKEVGGSVSGGVPLWLGGVFSNFAGGFSYAEGDNGVDLWTLSLGTGSRGWEGHVYGGYTSVTEW